MNKKLNLLFVNLPYISLDDINLKIANKEEKFNHLSFHLGYCIYHQLLKVKISV